jgi:two-component system, chemotaxis family, CheB/CheR fusion protein
LSTEAHNTDTHSRQALDNLLQYIREHRGFDFTGYKHASLERRINKRMRAVKIDSYQDYLDYLQVQPEEFTELFNTILINVTRFFRDPDSWTYLAEHVIPNLLAGLKPDEPVRVWNPGCSSGQESCTIAILLAEALGFNQFRERVKIYGTDVDEDALRTARFATYSSSGVEHLPDQYRAKYFELQDGQYVFHKDLRRSIIYGRHDLVQDAPISHIDLLICRNTLMYFTAETQGKILANFHFALKDGGVLFLGRGEMLLTHGKLFAPIELKQRVFRKIPSGNPRRKVPFVPTDTNDGPYTSGDEAWLRDAAFDNNSFAQIVLNADSELVLANSRARSQFGIRDQDLGRPFQDFQISYDPTDMRSKIDTVRSERRSAVYEGIRWTGAPGETRYLRIEIAPLLADNGDVAGIHITIADMSDIKALQMDLDRAKQDLETAHEELESTVEELETTNEELQSTNEELETMNEELQSTNEELETMNEELQSTNEELEAINTELRSRTTEIVELNAFLESILTSLRVGVVVIDQDFQVQIWNGKSTDFWGLRADEVVGSHFLNLDIGLPVDQLRGLIRDSLNGEVEIGEMVVRATNRVGRQVDCKVTSMPLTRHDPDVRGAIMLMEVSAASQDGQENRHGR